MQPRPDVYTAPVLAGPGRGQTATICRHPDCGGRTVAVDLTRELAETYSVPQHRATHPHLTPEAA